MGNCWASAFGPCSSKLSREHLISQGLWSGDVIDVVGLPWCKHQAKRVGLANLTARILCKDHNSALSPVDEQGKRAFEIFRDCDLRTKALQRDPDRKFRKLEFFVKGPEFERWILKTLINIACVGSSKHLRWRDSRAPINSPPEDLLNVVFGKAIFRNPKGLYAAHTPGQPERCWETVFISPLIHNQVSISGALLEFRGFRFVFNLSETPLPQIFELPDAPPEWRFNCLNYRPISFKFTHQGRTAHSVVFRWPANCV
jgi:hypothetical protein